MPNKVELKQKIEEYFSKGKLEHKETKKMIHLAMSQKIRLKEYRKRFCKKCLNDLRLGTVKVSSKYKAVKCLNCGNVNRWKLKY